jgi:hypothetical protein
MAGPPEGRSVLRALFMHECIYRHTVEDVAPIKLLRSNKASLVRLEVKSLSELVAGPDKQGQTGDTGSKPRSSSGISKGF